jgi:hypothetical protein
MGAKTMFPDPKIDTELMVLIFVAETKVSCLLAASQNKACLLHYSQY